MTGKPVHSMIRVLDEARATEFYRRAFGLEPADRIAFDDFHADLLAQRDLADSSLKLRSIMVDVPTPTCSATVTAHFAVVVDDLDGEHTRAWERRDSQARPAARTEAQRRSHRALLLRQGSGRLQYRGHRARRPFWLEADPRLSQPEPDNADQGGRYERNRSSQQNRSVAISSKLPAQCRRQWRLRQPSSTTPSTACLSR